MTSDAVVTYRHLEVTDAAAAAELERVCYPTVEAESLLGEDEVATHVQTFYKGNWAALVGDQLVGISLSWRLNFDFAHPIHTLADVDDPELHDDGGLWLYGLDTSVHPDFRGRGIAGSIYQLRRDYVRDNLLDGIIAGGMLPGYANLDKQLSAAQYVNEVVLGIRSDPTLTFQLRQGFVVEGILPGYVDGSIGGGVASLIVWRPDNSPQGT